MWGTGSGLLASTTKINKNGVNEREPVACGGGVWLEGVDKDGNPMSGFADAYNYYHNEAYYDNDSWLFDRTYVKLREISLRYDLPKKFVNNRAEDKVGTLFRHEVILRLRALQIPFPP